jgi:hypothetical protein
VEILRPRVVDATPVLTVSSTQYSALGETNMSNGAQEALSHTSVSDSHF